MSVDITGFGTVLTITASGTFPVGLPLTQFSDDADSIDFPNLVIAEAQMGVNGDLITYSKANPIPMTINIIPNSLDDISLNILFQANRPGKGKSNAQDVINAVIIYPNLRIVTLTNGRIISGIPGLGIANSGRLKTRSYSFTFENVVSV